MIKQILDWEGAAWEGARSRGLGVEVVHLLFDWGLNTSLNHAGRMCLWWFEVGDVRPLCLTCRKWAGTLRKWVSIFWNRVPGFVIGQ